MKRIELTKEQVNKKYKGIYIEFSGVYDYIKKQTLYTIFKTYKCIHENTTLGEDVGTEYEYTR